MKLLDFWLKNTEIWQLFEMIGNQFILGDELI
jgi:hypothetical protein